MSPSALGVVASSRRPTVVPPVSPLSSITGKKLWLRNSDLGAAGTLTTWPDSGDLARATLSYTKPTIVAGQTPNGKKAVSFAASNGLDFIATDGTVFTSSSVYSASYLPENAADTNNGTYWHAATTSMPQWWQAQYAAPKVVTNYTIRPENSAVSGPRDFVFQGWNGTSWIDLDARTGIVWSAGTAQTFSFSNSTAYTTYRIYITAAGGDGYLRIGTISFSVPFVLSIAASSEDRDGELVMVLKSNLTIAGGNNEGAWRAGTSGNIGHYGYGGVIYDETGVGGRYQFAPTMDINVWRIVRVSISGATLKYYLDDVLQMSTAIPAVRTWPDVFRIGSSYSNGGFNGVIAEVLIVDHAFTATEWETVKSYLQSELITPTPTFLDTFNRADVSTLGSPWVAPNWGIKLNRARPNSGVADGIKFAYRETSRSDCTMRLEVGSFNLNTDFYGPAGRLDSSLNGYIVQINGPGQNIGIFKYTGGVSTLLGTTVAYSPRINDTIDLVMSGTSLIVKVNGAVKISTTDATYQTNTKHGFWAYLADNTSFDNAVVF